MHHVFTGESFDVCIARCNIAQEADIARVENVLSEVLSSDLANKAPLTVEGQNRPSAAVQVKLQPSCTDAWNCLGHCYWEAGDLVSSLRCSLGCCLGSFTPA